MLKICSTTAVLTSIWLYCHCHLVYSMLIGSQPVCHSCNGVESLAECSTTTDSCSRAHVHGCYVQHYIQNGRSVYYSGCLNVSDCRNMHHNRMHPRTRSILPPQSGNLVCEDCCHGDHCGCHVPDHGPNVHVTHTLTTTVLPTAKITDTPVTPFTVITGYPPSNVHVTYRLTTTLLPTTQRTDTPVTPFVVTTGLKCHVCSGPGCGLLPESEKLMQCPNHFPYCMNVVENEEGEKLLTKSCASKHECESRWWSESSQQQRCVTYDAAEIYMSSFSCTYCCTTDVCNRRFVPAKDTLFIGL